MKKVRLSTESLTTCDNPCLHQKNLWHHKQVATTKSKTRFFFTLVMVQPTMASSCCKVSPGGHPWEAIKHSFCIIFFVCWEETRFWKPKTPLLSWLCYNPIDLSLHGPQIRKIFRYLNLWVVPENLKYKNKKWFYVIHLFNPTNFRNCRDQRHGGDDKIQVVFFASDLDLLGGLFPWALSLTYSFISDSSQWFIIFRLYIWIVKSISNASSVVHVSWFYMPYQLLTAHVHHLFPWKISPRWTPFLYASSSFLQLDTN